MCRATSKICHPSEIILNFRLHRYLDSVTIYHMKNERRTQWLRGVLDLCVLSALTGGERYGYELAQQLEEAGLGKVKGGTLYPLLARLEKADHVATEWREGSQGPGRKYYLLTDSGRQYLNQQTADWTTFSGLLDQLLQPKGKG